MKAKRQPHYGKVIAIALGATLLLAAVLLAFIWPSTTATLKHLPITIVEPEHVERMPFILMYADKEQFTLSTTPDRATALQLVKDRRVYGAVVLGQNPEVLVASANGSIVAQVMDEVAKGLQQRISSDAAARGVAAAPKVTVTDVVPHKKATFDMAILALPLTLGGIIGGIASAVFVGRRWPRLVMLTIYAVLAGVGMTAVVQGWLGLVPGDFLAVAGAISLIIFSVSSVIAGLYSAIGPAGIGLGVVYTLLIATPISGSPLPPQFLLEPWGMIGQWLAPGAGMSLLHIATFFPGADSQPTLLTLTAWSTVGSGLVLIGKRQDVLGTFDGSTKTKHRDTSATPEP